MRKAFLVILAIVVLFAVAAVAYAWVNALVNSIYGYRSPLKGSPPLTEDISRPLTSQVVLVLADGLRYDASLEMPYLDTLRKQGAHARLLSSPPSTTQPAWTTLISGAGSETNDTPLFDRDYEWIRPIVVDHLFGALARTGATAGITGFHWWEKLVPPDDLYTKYYVSTEGDAADRQIVDRATRFLEVFRPNFLLVHLRQIDVAGLEHGAASTEYQQAALRCDEYIRQLASNMNLKRSVLVVVSSHGHLGAGGHGGEEEITLTTPMVMVGENVRVGDYGVLAQTDLTPTMAALLGTPIPSAAQGRMRVDMLRMDRADQAEKLVALASQRVRIGNVYLGSIGRGGLSETAEGDMLVALSSLQVKNYDSASELASLAIQQADREMAQARNSRQWRERTQRGVPLAAAAFVPLWMLWHNRSKRTAWSMLAALLSAALYHALFLQQGNAYSFSRIPSGGLAATLGPSLEWAAIALAAGALIVTLMTWRQQERSIFAVVMQTYVYVALQLYFIGLLIGACTWWNGPLFTWYLPSFTVAYVHFVALMQAMLIAAMATVLPLVVVVVQRGLLAASDWRTRHATRTGGTDAGRNHR
jgi:hypothetical protein